jgi:hypothetical protein
MERAECCSALQCVAARESLFAWLQCVAVCCSVLQCVKAYSRGYNEFSRGCVVAVCCSVLQGVKAYSRGYNEFSRSWCACIFMTVCMGFGRDTLTEFYHT